MRRASVRGAQELWWLILNKSPGQSSPAVISSQGSCKVMLQMITTLPLFIFALLLVNPDIIIQQCTASSSVLIDVPRMICTSIAATDHVDDV